MLRLAALVGTSRSIFRRQDRQAHYGNAPELYPRRAVAKAGAARRRAYRLRHAHHPHRRECPRRIAGQAAKAGEWINIETDPQNFVVNISDC
jgi:hypothetical protein